MLLPTLQEKKSALYFYRTIAQDVGAHRGILQQLQERLGTMPDDESVVMLNNIIEGYDKLSEDVEDRISIAETHVSNHEAYLQTFEKMRDWISAIVNDTTTEDFATERDVAKSKVALVKNVLEQREEGDRTIDDCNQQLNLVLEQTSIPGHPALLKAFEEQKSLWKDFINRCVAMHNKLSNMFDQWQELEKMVEDLEAWMKHIESQVKDQSLKSNEETKRAHLEKLKSLEREIMDKGAEFNAVAEKSQSVESDSHLATRISRQATKYQAIKNQAKESVARYEQYVKEHGDFNKR